MGTVVIISSVHWDFNWQRHHDIAKGLAGAGYRVYFVRPLPARLWPGWRRLRQRVVGKLRRQSYTPGLRQPLPRGVKVIEPAGLPNGGRAAIALNRRVFMPRLAEQIRKLRIDHPLIVINYVPLAYALDLQRALEPDLSIYECVVDFSNVAELGDTPWIEPEVVAASDLVFADSPRNVERMERLGAQVVEVLPAVYPELFERARSEKPPSDGRLRCAYFGDVGSRLDIDLLREASHRYRLRLIGPINAPLEGFADDLELIPPLPHDELPDKLRDVDVLLLPYYPHAYAEAIIPAKTFECLATGKPTIVIGLTSLERYRELFYLCSTHQEFLAAIEQARNEDPALAERRIACARENSWDERMGRIIEAIDSYEEVGGYSR